MKQNSAFQTEERGFGSTEHLYIGGAAIEKSPFNRFKTIKLKNGYELSFGQIIALAGDFYGPDEASKAIACDSKGKIRENQACEQYFLAAYPKTCVKKMRRS